LPTSSDAEAPEDERDERDGRPSTLHLLVLAGLALLAAVLSLVVQHAAFPEGTSVVDEAVYASQADAVAAGRATLDADTHDPAFLPPLAGVQDGTVVFKYQPAWPAVLAASRAVSGSYDLAPALAAALLVLATWALALEASGRRPTALVAAALVTLSPFAVVQSATLLPYLPSAVVLAAGTALVLRAQRRASSVLFVAAGAVLGLGLFHRAYDAALVGLVLAVWLLWRDGLRRGGGDLIRVALGSLPFVVAVLGWNVLVTGDPLTLPFRVGAPADTFGWGLRSSFGPGDTFGGVDHTPRLAIEAMGRQAGSLPRWLPGGVVAVAVAALGIVLGRRLRAMPALVGIVLAFPVGYLAWWGAANMTEFGLQDALGPFYWLPILPALVTLVAMGLVLAGERWGRWAPGVAVAVLVLVTAVQLPATVDAVTDDGDARQALVDGLTPPVDDSLALVTIGGQYPYTDLAVAAELDGDRLVALDPEDPAVRFAIIDRFPGRSLWLSRLQRPFAHPFDPPVAVHAPAVLDEVLTWEPEVVLDEEAVGEAVEGTALPYLRVVDEEGEEQVVPLGGPQDPIRTSVTAVGEGDELVVDERGVQVPAGQAVEVALGADVGDLSVIGGPGPTSLELRWTVRATDDGMLEVLGPPGGWGRHAYPTGLSPWAPEDVGPFMAVPG
jgi:hypothetical protein